MENIFYIYPPISSEKGLHTQLNKTFYLKHIAQNSNHVKMLSMLKQKRKASLKNLIHLIACCCYPPKVCNKETTAKRDCVKEE